MSAKREKHPTQCQRLLKYLVKHKSITPIEAWNRLGIYRLSGRIYDLKEMGYGIETSKTTVTNAFGEKCTVGSYSLISTPIEMESST